MIRLDEIKIGFIGLLAINIADWNINWTAVIGLSTIALQAIKLYLDNKKDDN